MPHIEGDGSNCHLSTTATTLSLRLRSTAFASGTLTILSVTLNTGHDFLYSSTTLVYSTYQSHHQYGGGCTIQDYQNCSRGCWWFYLSGKMIFYRQPHYNLDFILLWFYPHLVKILSAGLFDYITFQSFVNFIVILEKCFQVFYHV